MSILDYQKDFALSTVRATIDGMNIWQKGGSHLEQLLKMELIDFSCRLQDRRCLENATEIFRKIDKGYFINPALGNT